MISGRVPSPRLLKNLVPSRPHVRPTEAGAAEEEGAVEAEEVAELPRPGLQWREPNVPCEIRFEVTHRMPRFDLYPEG